MSDRNLLSFFFELGHLKQIKHEGWRLAGINNPESVSEHSLRAAQIGFVLAKLEKYANPYEICTMLIFHDMAECRIGDIHKVAARYLQANEKQAVQDQTKPLEKIGEEIFNLWDQVESQKTPAGIIAKDADLLEQAVSAKEYLSIGFPLAQKWINNVGFHLKTRSAKKLHTLLNKTKSINWWDGLKIS